MTKEKELRSELKELGIYSMAIEELIANYDHSCITYFLRQAEKEKKRLSAPGSWVVHAIRNFSPIELPLTEACLRPE